MVITWRETLSYLTRMGVGEGSTLLVIGSGGNGLAYVAHAANLGAARVAVIGSLDRETVARRVGAVDYFDYHADDLPGRVLAASDAGYDFVLDAVGKTESADLGLAFLRQGGTLGIYGLSDFGQSIIHPLNSRGTFTFYNGGYDEAETHEQVMAFIQAGKLDAGNWLDLDHPYPLERIGEALEAARNRETVKALIQMSDEEQ
jgi:threonine dehydrogenase-like Zn-dependent dehydrogenase